MIARYLPVVLMLVFGIGLIGCKTIQPEEDVCWVLISKISDTEVQAQVVLPEGAKSVKVPVVGDVTARWTLRQPRIRVDEAFAEQIAEGNVVFLVNQKESIQKEEFIAR